MKSFASSLTSLLASETAAVFFLLELQLGAATIRYTDADHSIYDSSNAFSPRQFRFTGDLGSGVDGFEVEIVTIDQVVSAYFFTEDVRGCPAYLKILAISETSGTAIEDTLGSIIYDTTETAIYDTTGTTANYQPVNTANTLFTGEIDTWELTEKNSIRLRIVSELIHWQKKCLRIAHPDCPWPFKGTECGYSGSQTWCDQTYQRCSVLGNTNNFGGFRWLPSIIEARPIWGKKPER